MNIYVKYCRLCGKPFDVGTNQDLCQKCREIKKRRILDEDRRIK